MSIISAFKNYLLKTRVISLSYSADKVMKQLVKCDLENPDSYFFLEDGMKYFVKFQLEQKFNTLQELKFYSGLALNSKINPRFFSSQKELDKYYESVEKLRHFRELHDYVDNLSQFYWEVKVLLLDISRDTSTPNFWARREYTTNIFLHDVSSSLEKYNKLLNDLNEYPEWQQKVRDEIGYNFHIIFNNLQSDAEFIKVFANFDQQYFFK